MYMPQASNTIYVDYTYIPQASNTIYSGVRNTYIPQASNDGIHPGQNGVVTSASHVTTRSPQHDRRQTNLDDHYHHAPGVVSILTEMKGHDQYSLV